MTDLDLTIEDAPVLRAVGRYAIVREVGRGGTAVVYLARQTDLERDVALKELAAFHAAKPGVVERFLRESRLTGALNHPNVVTVHEYLEHDGVAYIAMEYFERGSLRPWVGHLTLPQIAGVLDGLLAGLAHAESRGVVHRDLKPENVMVTADGDVKIADFGIAKALLTPSGESLTASGTTVGTPAYMAPEQALGNAIGSWTDLYAVGVIAYELFAGEPPFPDDEMPLVTLLRHVNDPVPPLSAKASDLDPRLVAWVEGMLAKQPELRPAGAVDAREQFEEAVLAVVGARWRRGSRLQGEPPAARAELRPRAGTPTTAVAEARPRRSFTASRRRRLTLITAAACAVLAGVIAVMRLTPDESPQPSRAALQPDYVPNASERLGIAVAGPTLVVSDPRGRLVQLDRSSFRVGRVVRDPAGPVAPVVHSGRVYVADGETVTARRPGTLDPVAATMLRDTVALAATSVGPLVAATKGGRICQIVRATGPLRCGRVGFEPAGVGGSRQVAAAADGAAGRVVFLRRAGKRLVRDGRPVPVGRKPHGQLPAAGGRLYVPVERGISVVDVAERRVVRRIALPVTPASISLTPRGRLYAALPAIDRVAVVDTRSPRSAPRLIAAGRRPVSVAAGGDALFVASSATGRVLRIDPASGKQSAAVRIAALGARPPAPATLRGVTSSRLGRKTLVRLRFGGGALDPSVVVARDARIADGRALLELWQGSIASAVGRRNFAGLAVRVSRAPGRLVLGLSSDPRAFASLRARLRGPHELVLELTAPPRPVARASGGSEPVTPRIVSPPPAAPPPPPAPPPDDACCVTG